MLLDQASISRRFDELLANAEDIAIAVAWLTSTELTRKLIAFATKKGTHLRVLTGVYDYLTDPRCLRLLNDPGLVKVATPKHHKFHPKLYLFRLGGRTIRWIGSPNLTDRGFGDNIELLVEEDDDGAAAEWFKQQWRIWDFPTEEWLDEYEANAKGRSVPGPAVAQMRSPRPPGGPLDTWPGFYSALVRADIDWNQQFRGKYGVFTGKNTYLEVLRAAKPLMAKDWAALTKDEASILLGLIVKDNDYGMLGSMKGAGRANNVFLDPSAKNLVTRRDLQNELLLLLKAKLDANFPLMARRAHEVITNRPGFDSGMATRLLVLARPEVLLSVNNESVHGLADMCGIAPGSLKTSAGYEKLIRWVMNGRWWNTPPPTDPDELEAWSCRAALFDALVYTGAHFAAHV